MVGQGSPFGRGGGMVWSTLVEHTLLLVASNNSPCFDSAYIIQACWSVPINLIYFAYKHMPLDGLVCLGWDYRLKCEFKPVLKMNEKGYQTSF